MQKYRCSVCGYIYDDKEKKWEDLPDDWVCPICGATKAEFENNDKDVLIEERKSAIIETSSDVKEMSALEISALCTNLARGCEKQYKTEQALLFNKLAEFYKKSTTAPENPDLDKLIGLIEKNINEEIPNANNVATEAKDRGALRALVWDEKVTRIIKSLLTRYQKQGDSMLENTGIYVCTICGFIYIGDNLPEVCPVCKVPNWKFEQIEGGNANV